MYCSARKQGPKDHNGPGKNNLVSLWLWEVCPGYMTLESQAELYASGSSHSPGNYSSLHFSSLPRACAHHWQGLNFKMLVRLSLSSLKSLVAWYEPRIRPSFSLNSLKGPPWTGVNSLHSLSLHSIPTEWNKAAHCPSAMLFQGCFFSLRHLTISSASLHPQNQSTFPTSHTNAPFLMKPFLIIPLREILFSFASPSLFFHSKVVGDRRSSGLL